MSGGAGISKQKRKAEEEMREIEVLIISAQGLKKVKHVTKMKAYAAVYVEREVHVARTRVDETGGVNPRWNEVVKVKFHSKLPEQNVMAALNIDIYAHGLLRDKPVGTARLLVCDVLKGGNASEPADNPIQCMAINVWRLSGRPHGILNLWVPPTGKFLTRPDSDSVSGREDDDEEMRCKHPSVSSY